MASKKQYFEYFHNDQKIKRNYASTEPIEDPPRPKTSQYQMAQLQKLLPHITQEYQYRITNQLLQHKIQNPRRDKIIVQAVQSAGHNRQTPSRKKRRLKTQQRSKENHTQSCHTNFSGDTIAQARNSKQVHNMSNLGKKNQIQRLYKTFGDTNSTCNNYKNDYLISLQNTRMGKRLINVRSVVSDILTKTYYTYQIYNGKLVNKDKYMSINRNSSKFRNDNRNFGKINNGIKSFFKNKISYQQHRELTMGFNQDEEYQNNLNKTMLLEDKSLRKMNREERNCRTNSHAYQTKNPFILETYGVGDYNFVIKRLQIKSNPPLKPQTLLVLQVIQRESELNSILNREYTQKHNYRNQMCTTQKGEQDYGCQTTSSFTYEYISVQTDKNLGIKFRVHRLRQIFIRILRNQGIRQRQIGVFKINLQPFFTREKSEFPYQIYVKEKETQGITKKREVFAGEFQGNLSKLKIGQTNTEIKVNYLFYNRYFKAERQVQEFSETKSMLKINQV